MAEPPCGSDGHYDSFSLSLREKLGKWPLVNRALLAQGSGECSEANCDQAKNSVLVFNNGY
jgi:hypothetical protein